MSESKPVGAPDEPGISPEIAHPTSGEPYGMFATLRELSSWILALSGAAAGAWAVVTAWVLFIHNGQKVVETTMIVVATLLLALIFVLWKFAAFARTHERDRQRTERDSMVSARVREAVAAVDMAPAVQRGRDEERKKANLEIDAAKSFREAELSSLRTRLSQAKQSCNGWEKDYKRLQDTNLALSASLEKLQQAASGGPSPTLKQVQKLRRARTEFQKNVISDYIATIERLRGEPTWVENRSDDDPEWTHWMRRERVLLWQAVCLSFNSNPDKVSIPSEGPAAIHLTATNYHHLSPGRDHYKNGCGKRKNTSGSRWTARSISPSSRSGLSACGKVFLSSSTS